MDTATESLEDLMRQAFNLSLDLAYTELSPDGGYFTAREGVFAEAQEDMIFGWVDGLTQKFYSSRTSGHCSLQAMIDFDVAAFEEEVRRDIATMTELFAQVGKPVRLDFAEMRRRGYTGAWAGLPNLPMAAAA